MSRPSSFHGATHRDSNDDFSLPLFAPSQPITYAPQQHIQQQPSQPPPPPPAAPPRSPARQNQQQQAKSGHLAPSSASYAPPPSGSFTHSHTSSSNGSAAASSLLPGQRQTMHFPTYAPSAYPDEAAGGSALGSLARSASLGTGRRKDPFSYPSDDVESGMAGDNWGSNAPYGRPTQQMPQPYVNTNRSGSESMSSPMRYSQQLPSSSMGPPPMPNMRGPPISTNILSSGATVASPAMSTPSHNSALSPNAPSNPYVPRAAEGGGAGDTWRSYRRNSHHSPQSGSVSPLRASPHSPSIGGQYDPSPHLLTPQGSSSNLPSSPHLPYLPSSPQQQHHQQLHSGYQPTQRSHSSSFTVSQPVTPSGRYEHPSNRPPQSVSPPRQGFRPVRDWSDLKPRVNSHPQGRRADTQLPGKYMSVSLVQSCAGPC